MLVRRESRPALRFSRNMRYVLEIVRKDMRVSNEIVVTHDALKTTEKVKSFDREID